MELILVNKNNQTLDLLNNTDKFVLSKCEALHGIDTDIQEESSPYLDGTIIEGVKALPRGISMTFKVVPDIKDSIEFFTNIVKSKQYVTLQETEKGNTISIKGIATIPPYTRMMSNCEIVLDIYCGQPYWEDLNSVISAISMYIDLLYFPMATGQYFTQFGRPFGALNLDATKTFTNDGDTSVGMIIDIVVLNAVDNVAIGCSTGDQNGWRMVINAPLQANDEVKINTTKGQKSITINGNPYYVIEGISHQVVSLMEFTGNDWLQLETGANTFSVGEWENNAIVPNPNIYFSLTYKRRYE